MGGGNGGVGMDHYRNDAGKMSGRGIWIKEGHSRVDGGDAGDGPGTDLGMLAAPPPSGYPRKPCLVEGGVTPKRRSTREVGWLPPAFEAPPPLT